MIRVHHAALALVSAIFVLAFVGCSKQEEVPQSSAPSLAETGKELVGAVCTGCHTKLDNGKLSRISFGRRTPEGWDMTLVRMMHFHGVSLTKAERRAIVKYLSDTEGLAPSETAPFRYALERRPNVIEKGVDPKLETMCVRCHSAARIGLQRRTKEEWLDLVNMHVGQWPTLEYQMLSRERNWWDEATSWVVDDLAKSYPLDTPAWTAWQAAPKPDIAGKWRYVSYVPGHGYDQGQLAFTKTGDDEYSVHYDSVSPDGGTVSGDYQGTVYTGYEWRGTGKFGGREGREVAALSPDGKSFKGRWFYDDHPEEGGSVHALRMTDGPTIMAVTGEALKQGVTTKITILGLGLSGAVDLGPGIKVDVTKEDPGRIVAMATVAPDAALGRRGLKVGSLTLDDAFAVYDHIDRVAVTPDYAIARVGDNGGTRPVKVAQFEALAMHNGPDGKAGTADDFRIGVMDAAWSTAPYTETAAAMDDVKYAGTISATGLFTPAGAGPNPARKRGTNNAGDLKVIATVQDGDKSVRGNAHLIVTSQSWNRPPIY